MSKLRKIFLLIAIFSLLVFSFNIKVYAAAEAIIVDVEQWSFGLNEAIDITVAVVDSAGQTTKDYVGDIYMEINIIDPADYTLPNDGYLEFMEEDQWSKTFSKGLIVKVPGTYKIQAYDLIDETLIGYATVIVWEVNEKEESDINLIAPVMGGVEIENNVDVIAQAIELPNSKFQIFMNEVLKSEWISTEKWDITAYVTWAWPGQNTLQVKIVDVNGMVLGQSPLVSFKFQSNSDNIFKNIEILPTSTVRQWDKLTFKVTTDDTVTSADLRFSDGNYTPLDNVSPGLFTKTITTETPWTITADLSLVAGGNKKLYDSVASFTVEDGTAVWSMKFYTDSIDKTTLTVMWWQIGQAAKYRVEYGTSPTVLSVSQDVSVNEIKISNLTPDQKYYIKVTPLDLSWNPVGSPSAVQDVTPGHLGPPSAGDDPEPPTCVVKWILVKTGMIWDKYYLIRDGVENVEKYIVYRSDRETSNIADMKKVWESTDTQFEYRFDAKTRKYTYAYYAVEAICTDGANLQMWSVKKVNVWPMDNFMLFIAVVMFLYVSHKLYAYSSQE